MAVYKLDLAPRYIEVLEAVSKVSDRSIDSLLHQLVQDDLDRLLAEPLKSLLGELIYTKVKNNKDKE